MAKNVEIKKRSAEDIALSEIRRIRFCKEKDADQLYPAFA